MHFKAYNPPILLFCFSFSFINFGRLLQFYLPFHEFSLWLALISYLTCLLSIVLPITVFFIYIIFMFLFQIFSFVFIMSFSCLLDSIFPYMYIVSNLILKFPSYWSLVIPWVWLFIVLADGRLEHQTSSRAVWTMSSAGSIFNIGSTCSGLQRLSFQDFHIYFSWDYIYILAQGFASCGQFKNAHSAPLSGSAIWEILFLQGRGLGPVNEVFLISLRRTGKTFTGSWLLFRGSDLVSDPTVETRSQFQPLRRI